MVPRISLVLAVTRAVVKVNLLTIPRNKCIYSSYDRCFCYCKGPSERKREHSSSSLPSVPPSKKPKVGGPVIRAVSVTAPGPSTTNLPTADRPVSASAQAQSTVEFWETLAAECEPCDLVSNVGKALDHGDNDKLVSLMCLLY